VKLIDCLTEKTVEVCSKLADRDLVLARLVDLLLAGGRIADRETLLAEIITREKLGSTGIGDNVAIPHVHLKGVTGLRVAMMTVPAGVDFNAIDDLPCKIFIIVVGPDEDREGYMKLLSEVSRILRNEKTRDALLAAKTRAEFFATLRGVEAA
jgi:PTS system fructose-specific IIC component